MVKFKAASADTHRRLCERFAPPVIDTLICQDIKTDHTQKIVSAGPLLEHVAAANETAATRSRGPSTEMHISVNTVKTHLTHIYRKLATTRRSDAVRRARQLDLI